MANPRFRTPIRVLSSPRPTSWPPMRRKIFRNRVARRCRHFPSLPLCSGHREQSVDKGFAPAAYESQVASAALRRATSASTNSNSRAGIERAGFQTTRSSPFVASRVSASVFSSSASSAILSCTAQIVRIDPRSARLRAQQGLQVQTLGGSSVNFIGLSFQGLRIGIEQDVARRSYGKRLHSESRPKVRRCR